MNVHQLTLTFCFFAFVVCTQVCGDDKEAIEKVVFDAQRAGVERGDLQAYLAQWTKDARIIAGRGPIKGEFEITLDRQQIEDTRRLRFSWRPVEYGNWKLGFRDVQTTITGDHAQMKLKSTVTVAYSRETVGEIYKLRRTKDGWRVYENRFWPIETKQAINRITKYDAATWKQLDADVDRFKNEDKPLQVLGALQAAYRWKEAHKQAKTVFSSPKISAREWLSRAGTALQAGDADDAIYSFKMAKKIEPQLEIPSAVKWHPQLCLALNARGRDLR